MGYKLIKYFDTYVDSVLCENKTLEECESLKRIYDSNLPINSLYSYEIKEEF